MNSPSNLTLNRIALAGRVRLSVWADVIANAMSDAFVIFRGEAMSSASEDMHAALLGHSSPGTLSHMVRHSGWVDLHQEFAGESVYFFIREAALAYRELVDAGLANGGDYVDTVFDMPFPATFASLADYTEGDDPERDKRAFTYYQEQLWPALVRVMPEGMIWEA